MTGPYSRPDPDPRYPDDDYFLVTPPQRKPGLPRPVLYWAIGALIVIVAVLVITGLVR